MSIRVGTKYVQTFTRDTNEAYHSRPNRRSAHIIRIKDTRVAHAYAVLQPATDAVYSAIAASRETKYPLHATIERLTSGNTTAADRRSTSRIHRST